MDRRHWWLVSKLQESFGDSLRSAQLETFLCQEGTLPTLLAFTGEKSPPAIYVWRQGGSTEDGARRGNSTVSRPTFGSTIGAAGGSSSSLSATLGRGRSGRHTFSGSVGSQGGQPPATSAMSDEDASAAVVTAANDAAANAVIRADGVRFVMDTSPPAEFLDKCVYFLRLRRRRRQHPPGGGDERMDDGEQSDTLAVIPEQGHPGEDVDARSDGSASPSDQDADPEAFASHVLWGEIEANLTCDMHAVFNSVLLPRIARQDWGEANVDEVHNLRQTVDKFFAALPDSNLLARAAHLRTVSLRTSEDPYFSSFVPGARPADPVAQAAAEEIVEDWIETMEEVLCEAAEERPGHLKGVSGEEEFWLERQNILAFVTDQLKSQACQGIVGVLVSAQSRVVKRWRHMDACITDASNECKDILRYLDNIRPQMKEVETLCNPEHLSSAIPALLSGAKLSSSMARHVNVQTFVESLFARLSQRVSQNLIEFLSESSQPPEAPGQRLAAAIIGPLGAEKPMAASWPCWLKPAAVQPSGAADRDAGESAPGELELKADLQDACQRLQQVADVCRLYHDSVGSVLSRRRQPRASAVDHGSGSAGHAPDHVSRPSASGSPRLPRGSVARQNAAGRVRKAFGMRGSKGASSLASVASAFAAAGTGASLRDESEGGLMQAPSGSGSANPTVAEDTFIAIVQLQQRATEAHAVLRPCDRFLRLRRELHGTSMLCKTERLAFDLEQVVALLVALPDCLRRPRDRVVKGRLEAALSTVRRIEAYVPGLLADGIEQCRSAEQGIQFLRRFKIVEDAPYMTNATDASVALLFRRYAQELEKVQQHYEAQKEAPPVVRGAPPTVGHMMWARQMLARIEGPLLFFKQRNGRLGGIDAAEASQVFAMYNRLSAALLKYESMWLSQWRTRVQNAASGFCATLLVQHPTTRKLLINVDPNVLSLMEEARAMHREGISIPSSTAALLPQGAKYKTFADSLRVILERYEHLEATIPTLLKPLLAPRFADVMKTLRPGLISLTWEASNIDVYLSRVDQALLALEADATQLRCILDDHVEQAVRELQQLQLSDLHLQGRTSLSVFNARQSEMLAAATHTAKLTSIGGMTAIVEILEKAATMQSSAGASAQNIALEPKYLTALVRHYEERMKAGLKEALIKGLAGLSRFLATKSCAPLLPEDLDTDEGSHTHPGEGPIELPFSLPPSVSLIEATRDPARKGESGGPFSSGYLVLNIELASPKILQLPAQDEVLCAFGDIVDSMIKTCTVGAHLCSRAAESTLQRFGLGKAASVRLESSMEAASVEKDRKPDVGGADQPCSNRLAVRMESNSHRLSHSASEKRRNDTRTPESQVSQVIASSVAQEADLTKDEDVRLHVAEIETSLQRAAEVGAAKLTELDETTWKWEQTSSNRATNILKRRASKGTIQRRSSRKEVQEMELDLQQLVDIERSISRIPDFVSIGGPFRLRTRPMRLALAAEANAWKAECAAGLYSEASQELRRVGQVARELRAKMNQQIETLEDLQRMVDVLHTTDVHSQDLDTSALEDMYSVLQEIGLSLPREETAALESLQRECMELRELTVRVRHDLTKTRRPEFERLLDTQAKSLMVASIHLRNSFNTSGPTIKEITPSESLLRLRRLQELHLHLAKERKTLAAAEALLTLPLTLYPELDRTGRDLERLSLLYDLYERFLELQHKFLNAYWNDVDLMGAQRQLQEMADGLNELPEELRRWEAFTEMEKALSAQLRVLPLLLLLASPCIRDRHWREVMHMTKVTFPLEGLTINKVMSLHLPNCANKVQELARTALSEAELENGLSEIQNTWNEHVFPFQQPTNSRHMAFLDETSAQHLISSAQESHMRLHAMLNSPSLGPHRTDIVAWMAKLKEMGAFLTRWLEVQQLWSELELMVSVAGLETQAKQLHMVLRDLLKFGSLAQETANIVQFCFGADSDNTKISVLDGFRDRLESCRKSLAGFLEEKRKSFARFYYLSDTMLLRALGTVLDEGAEVALPLALRQLLPSIYKVTVETTPTAFERKASRRSLSMLAQAAMQSALSSERRGSSFSRRSSSSSQEELTQRISTLFITNIISKEGERLRLSEPIPVVEDVATWADTLLRVASSTLHARTRALSVHLPKGEAGDGERGPDSSEVTASEVPPSPRPGGLRPPPRVPQTPPSTLLERTSSSGGGSKRLRSMQPKYAPPTTGEGFSPTALDTEVAQIGLLATRLHWTAVIASGIEQVRVNRFALRSAHQEVTTWANKVMSSAAARKRARTSGLVQHKMQALVTLLLHLRDLSEELLTSRCRDLSDFNWQKQLRWYVSATTGKAKLMSLYASLDYGDDFLGVPDTLYLSSLMDKYHMLLLQTLSQGGGPNGTPIPSVVGPANSGKADIIESLSGMLGRQLVRTACTSTSQPAALTRMVLGLSLSKSWGVFMEISDLTLQALSVLVEHVRLLQYRVREAWKRPTLKQFGLATMAANRNPWDKKLGGLASPSFRHRGNEEGSGDDNATIAAGGTFAVFATVTVGHSNPLPDETKACFREIHISQPSPSVIVYAHCLASGLFYNSKAISEKMLKLLSACSETFADLPWLNFGTPSIRRLVQQCAYYRTTVKDAAHMSGRASRLGSGNGARARSGTGLRIAKGSLLVGSSAASQGGMLEEQDALILALAFYSLYRTAMERHDLAVLEEIVSSVVPLFAKARLGMFNTDDDVRTAIETVAARSGLVPEEAWVDRGIDVYRCARTHRAVVLQGASGVGKTSCVSTLIGALSHLSEDAGARNARASVFTYGRPSIAESESGRLSEVPPAVEELDGESRQHRLHRIFPGAVREEYLYGYHRADGEWVEGIVPSIVRQALHGAGSNTMHWIVLDGPLAKTWTHHLRQALSLSSSSYICLGNGDQLYLPVNLRFIFETTKEQAQASAPLAPHIATVFMDEACLPWQSIVTPWLRSRRTPEAELLDPLFKRYLEPCLELIASDSMQSCSEVPRCGRIRTLLMIITSLLEESVSTATILAPVHMECNFLFAMAWALGGALDVPARRIFHDHLCEMTSLMPNENASCTIFDYCITASADWESWSEVAADLEQELSTLATDHMLPRGRYVPTSESACASFLMQLVSNAGGSALIVGEHGSGRSALISQATQQQRHVKALHQLGVTGATPARLLQRFITRHTTRRTGHVYGADAGKPLLLVLDDIDSCCQDLYVNQQELRRKLQGEEARATGPAGTVIGLRPTTQEFDVGGVSLAGRGNVVIAEDHTHAHEVLRLLLEEGQWFPADGEAERRSHTLHELLNKGKGASRADGLRDEGQVPEAAVFDELQDARWITDLQVVATAQPSVGRTTTLQRVTRHLAVFYMPPTSAESSQAVLSAQLMDTLQPVTGQDPSATASVGVTAGASASWATNRPEAGNDTAEISVSDGYFRRIMAVEALVEMTRALVKQMTEITRPNAGNAYQLVYGAKDANMIIRSMRRINLGRADLVAMAAFWRQECLRVLADRMPEEHTPWIVDTAIFDQLRARGDLFGPWPATAVPCASPGRLPWFAYTPPCGFLLHLQQTQRALAIVGLTVMDVYMRLASKSVQGPSPSQTRGSPTLVAAEALAEELYTALRPSLPLLELDVLTQEICGLADSRGRLSFRAACQLLIKASRTTPRTSGQDAEKADVAGGVGREKIDEESRRLQDTYPQLLDFVDCLNPVEYFHAPPSQPKGQGLKGRVGACQPCPKPLLTAMLRLYLTKIEEPGRTGSVLGGTDNARVHTGAAQLGAAVDTNSADDPVTPDFSELVLRICRIINLGASHGILVAPPGSGVKRACLVASSIANCTLQEVSGRNVRTFNRDMRAVYRTGGSKNKQVCAVIDGEQLPLAVMERLHSFVVQGEVFDLFAAEEEQALYEGVEDDLAKDGTPGVSAQSYFQARLERNVHIIIHFNSWQGRLRALAQNCPALLSQCYLYNRPNLTLQGAEQYALAFLCRESSFYEYDLGSLLKIASSVAHLFVAAKSLDTRSVTDLQRDVGKADALTEALSAAEAAAGSSAAQALDSSLLAGGLGAAAGASATGASGTATTGTHAPSAGGGPSSISNAGAAAAVADQIATGVGGINGITLAGSAAAATFLRTPQEMAGPSRAASFSDAAGEGEIMSSTEAAAKNISFCELRTVLNTFVAVYGQKREQQRQQQQQLERVLYTCQETDAHIASLRDAAQSNSDRIKSLDKSLAEALDKLSLAAAEEIVGMVDEGLESDDDEELLSVFVNEKRHAIRNRVVVRRERPSLASPDSHMRALRLEASLREVEAWQSKLTLKRIDTLRSLTSPPQLVQLVCDMVMIVLGRSMEGDALVRRAQPKFTSNWAFTAAQLQDPQVADRLQRFNVLSLDDERVELLDVYLAMPYMNVQRVRRASKDAYVVLEWICHMLSHVHLVNEAHGRSKRYSSAFVEQLLAPRRVSSNTLYTDKELRNGSGRETPASPSEDNTALATLREEDEDEAEVSRTGVKLEEAQDGAQGSDAAAAAATPQGRVPNVQVEDDADSEGDERTAGMSEEDETPLPEGADKLTALQLNVGDSSTGMRVVAASTNVQKLQVEYDQLLGEKQACEATALDLERRLRAAHKRQSSFESHVSQWNKQLRLLKEGRWFCTRNSLMIAAFATFGCNCTEGQRKALKWQLLVTSQEVMSNTPVDLDVDGAEECPAFLKAAREAAATKAASENDAGGADANKLLPDAATMNDSRPSSTGRRQAGRSPSVRRRSPHGSRPGSRSAAHAAPGVGDTTAGNLSTPTENSAEGGAGPSAPEPSAAAAQSYPKDQQLLWTVDPQLKNEFAIVFRDCTLSEYLDQEGREEPCAPLEEALALTTDVKALARLALRLVAGNCCPLFYDPAELLVPWLTQEMASDTDSSSTASNRHTHSAPAAAAGDGKFVIPPQQVVAAQPVSEPPLRQLSVLKTGHVRVCSYESRNFRADLKACLTSGLVLVVTNITSRVWNDVRIADVLNRKQCLTSQGHVAVSVAGEIVDWHPNFRLLLLTRTPLSVPSEYIAQIWPFSMAPGQQAYHLCAFARVVRQRQPGLYTSLRHTLSLLTQERKEKHDLSRALLELLSQVQRNNSGDAGNHAETAAGMSGAGALLTNASVHLVSPVRQDTGLLRLSTPRDVSPDGTVQRLLHHQDDASGQDLHWADSIVDTQYRFDLAVSRVTQTRKEACELVESMDASLKAAAAVAGMLNAVAFLPTFAPYCMALQASLTALEEALDHTHMEPSFTGTLLCRQFAALLHAQLQVQLTEPHRRMLEVLLALHCQPPVDDAVINASAAGVTSPHGAHSGGMGNLQATLGAGGVDKSGEKRTRQRRRPGGESAAPGSGKGGSRNQPSHSAGTKGASLAAPTHGKVGSSGGGQSPVIAGRRQRETSSARRQHTGQTAAEAALTDQTLEAGNRHLRRIVQEDSPYDAEAAAAAAAAKSEASSNNLLMTPDWVHEDQPLAPLPVYLWLRRAVPHLAADWPQLDLGQSTDSKGLVMPLADLKMKNAQLESKIATLQGRVMQWPWLVPLAHMVEPLARHRADWTSWKDTAAPELVPMPTGANMKNTPDLALMVGGSLRPDRFLPLAEQYVQSKLGRSLTERLPTLWQALQGLDTLPSTRPLLILRNDGHSTVRGAMWLRSWATERDQEVVHLSLTHGVNTSEVRDTLTMCMSRGLWLMLTGVQMHISLAMECVQHVASSAREQHNENFRLVLLHGGAQEKPEALLSLCSCIYIGDEGSFRGQLAQMLAGVPPDTVQCCSRADWVPLLHNLCFLHVVVNTRRKFGLSGWSGMYHWTQEHLLQVVNFARQQFEKGESSQRITSVRYYVEMVYSSQITFSRDRRLLSSLIGSWICSTACKPDYEFFRRPLHTAGDSSPRSYRLPAPNTRRGREYALLDIAAQVTVAPELDETALAWACQLPGHSLPGRNAGSVWLREALRQLAPVLDVSGASCLPWPMPPASDRPGSHRHRGERASTASTAGINHPPMLQNQQEDAAHVMHAAGITSHAAAAAAATAAGVAALAGTCVMPASMPVPGVGATGPMASTSSGPPLAGAIPGRRPPVTRRVSRGRVGHGGRSDRLRQNTPCPSHRPTEIHRLLHSLPPMTAVGKQRRRLEATNATPILQRFLLLQAHTVRAAHRHIMADLRHIDEVCAGRRSLDPEASTLLQQIEQDKTPSSWRQLLVGPHRGLSGLPLSIWLEAMVQQARDVERASSLGLRTASFGLGLFPMPRPLLTALRVRAATEYGEEAVFHADITAREREHLREPPSEGVFLHGLVLHGALWEAPPGEAREQPRFSESSLPVIHVHYSAARSDDDGKNAAKSRARNESDSKKRGLYRCPVYINLHDRPGDDLQVLSLGLPCETVDIALNMAVHGVHCSLRQ